MANTNDSLVYLSIHPSSSSQPTSLHPPNNKKGNVLIAGSKDGTIWMWLAHTGHCVHVLTGHEGPVTCGLFTSDGKAIASGRCVYNRGGGTLTYR